MSKLWPAFLVLSIVCEVIWPRFMVMGSRQQLWPYLVVACVILILLFSLDPVMKALSPTIGYVLFVGGATIGSVCVDAFILRQPPSLVRILCIGLILSGIAGLKLLDKS